MDMKGLTFATREYDTAQPCLNAWRRGGGAKGLKLSYQGLTPPEVETVARMLRYLVALCGGVMVYRNMRLTCSCRVNGVLAGIDLRWNRSGSEGATALAEALKPEFNGVLKKLYLDGNEIGDEGSKALGEALKVNGVLTRVELGSNRIGYEGAAALAKALEVNRVLTRVALGSNRIGYEGAAALAKALKPEFNGVLTYLDLDDNEIGPEGSKELAEALKVNGVLTELDLRRNQIGSEGATALAKALEVNGVLTTLNLRENQIGPDGASALAEALKVNRVLTILYLGGNEIGDEGSKALGEALQVNGVLTTLAIDMDFPPEAKAKLVANRARAEQEAQRAKEARHREEEEKRKVEEEKRTKDVGQRPHDEHEAREQRRRQAQQGQAPWPVAAGPARKAPDIDQADRVADSSRALGRVLCDASSPPTSLDPVYLARITQDFSEDRMIGQGAFGSVYRGVDGATGAMVAVKRLGQGARPAEAEDLARQFQREVQILSRVRHPNVIRILAHTRPDAATPGPLCIVYELGQYGSLEAVLQDDAAAARLGWPARLGVLLGVSRALGAMHLRAEGAICHRDVKSANVVLTAGHIPLMIDCGLSIVLPDASSVGSTRGATVATMTQIAGTQAYACPQYVRNGKYGPKCDVYSFGIVVLEVLSGHPATQEKTDLKGSLDDEVITPDTRPGECPAMIRDGLIQLAEQCTEYKLAARPNVQAVMHILGDLERQHRAHLVPALQDEVAKLSRDLQKLRASNEDSGPRADCMVCLDTTPESAGLYCCGGEGPPHFLCVGCLAGHVETQCGQEGVNRRFDDPSCQLLCCETQCRGVLEDVLAMRLLPKEHAKMLLKLRDMSKEVTIAMDFGTRLEKEKREMADLIKNDAAEYHRRHIQENIINLR